MSAKNKSGESAVKLGSRKLGGYMMAVVLVAVVAVGVAAVVAVVVPVPAAEDELTIPSTIIVRTRIGNDY